MINPSHYERLLIVRRRGMVTQVVHVPSLNALSHLFQITCRCDVSEEAMKYSHVKVPGTSRPNTRLDVDELCSAPEMELVLIASNHALHASEAVLAPQANEYVVIEKPIALNLQDTNRIIGPNPVFLGQPGTYPRTFHDYRESDC
ncbi:hypothetical protein ASPVEDRAFT_763212 [Aspergillus versicolor CBS 583.65]|uniref:Gfo/Idh/MocA-like oxidoreductase N-terminal domain-containing protein n=1 Tax=Aspergillus versicolor CBS 583.65 TaxID=1036611 RepID=A0A1L9PQY2_ASPVE|nr:uncharacterized protein ASPVEDRAFT_763212 [Aspergillus versicolor CBS 583.65]OJJ03913.1 hypothetical protein ASPVEDRAFT_763212 [Aspergillus versicolor CBS 583.65]